jgi:glucose/arabinose dehydrogenase
LTYLKGTTTNATHWTVQAVCRGCTSWQANDGSDYALNGTGTTQFAWARGGGAVGTPSDNSSAFPVHQDFGKWTHDLNAARSPNFNAWVSSNLVPKATTTGAPAPSSTTLTTSVKPTSSAPSSPTGKVTVPSTCAGAGSPAYSSVLASGWKATKVLGGLTSPRSLVWDSAGNLLIVQSGKGITIHKIGADGCVTSSATLVALNSLNHGITFSPDGKTLYASSMTTAYSWPYTASTGTVGTRATVITGMVNGGSHVTRTLLIGAHAPNLLIVSHGSQENLDMPTLNPATARAIVKVFDLSTLPAAGYNYQSGGYNMGYGLRNDIGLTFDNNKM